jgi:hypothetical protein
MKVARHRAIAVGVKRRRIKMQSDTKGSEIRRNMKKVTRRGEERGGGRRRRKGRRANDIRNIESKGYNKIRVCQICRWREILVYATYGERIGNKWERRVDEIGCAWPDIVVD